MLRLQAIFRRHNRSSHPLPNRNRNSLNSVHSPDSNSMDLGASDDVSLLSLQHSDLPVRKQRHQPSRISH